MTDTIHTARLDLIPMTLTFMRASLDGDLDTAEQLLRASLPVEWPGENAGLLSLRLQQLEADPALQPWLVRAMALRQTRTMIGHIGFHDAPGADCLRPYSAAAAEFGFTVYPAFRRQGFAREASVALMQWATHERGVTEFVMSIRPDNAPSQALAASLGFVRIGSHIDDVDGVEDILESKVR
jgi:[ribosomal protein S5]-alanine N-acetyltransferase